MHGRTSHLRVALVFAALATGCDKPVGPPTTAPAGDAPAVAEEGSKDAESGSLLQRIQGEWVGQYTLTWMDPAKSAFSVEASDGTATVTGDRIEYTWEFRGKPQHGSVEVSGEGTAVETRFVDTWHTPDNNPLVSTGSVDEGLIDVLGSYPAGDGPDWGWRTEIGVANADAFALRMYNITPDGQEAIAVELVCKRAP